MEWTPIVDCAYDATITVTEKDTDEWYVSVQLKDYEGNNLTVPANVTCYLSSDSSGLNHNAATVTTETAITTNGSLVTSVTGILYNIVSEASGLFDCTITDTGEDVYYWVVVLPNGRLSVSGAITFAS